MRLTFSLPALIAMPSVFAFTQNGLTAETKLHKLTLGWRAVGVVEAHLGGHALEGAVVAT